MASKTRIYDIGCHEEANARESSLPRTIEYIYDKAGGKRGKGEDRRATGKRQY